MLSTATQVAEAAGRDGPAGQKRLQQALDLGACHDVDGWPLRMAFAEALLLHKALDADDKACIQVPILCNVADTGWGMSLRPARPSTSRFQNDRVWFSQASLGIPRGYVGTSRNLTRLCRRPCCPSFWSDRRSSYRRLPPVYGRSWPLLHTRSWQACWASWRSACLAWYGPLIDQQLSMHGMYRTSGLPSYPNPC